MEHVAWAFLLIVTLGLLAAIWAVRSQESQVVPRILLSSVVVVVALVIGHALAQHQWSYRIEPKPGFWH